MANHQAGLDAVLLALADPTRRAIVQRLGRGSASVKELAAPFAIALPSLLKHLGVLERSGLVRSRKTGRVRECRLAPEALDPVARWLAEQRAVWEARTDRLAEYVETLHAKERADGR